MTDEIYEMCRGFASISIYDEDEIEIKIQLSSHLETFTALNNTSAMLPMVPALLLVLC